MLNATSYNRCVNIDWLEVHAREPMNVPHDFSYYASKGYNVRARDYGTRVYRQMFTILETNEEPLLEIRREPASQGLMGIHDANECHIRLCNRTCYFDNAAQFLANFLQIHGYTDIRISRIDICLDFEKFDMGDMPQAFISRYLRHRYAKINQGNISAHGKDSWSGQEFNSLSWGSKSSTITTKIYNKTLELYDAKLDRYKKPYIREAWFRAGLIDNIQRVTKNNSLVNVWRVEFSICSSVKNWVPIEIDGISKNYQSLKNTLECYMGRDKILIMFASLANHYFHFKHVENGKRKDRCKDKVLFDFSASQVLYKIGRDNTALGSGEKFQSKFNRLIEKLQAYQITHSLPEIHKACTVLIQSITEENIRSDMANPFDREELEFLKKLIHVRTADPNLSYEAALSEVKKLLNITNRTIKTF